MCVCGGKQHFDKKPRCTLLIPPSPVGFVHHPWGNRTKPKQLTRWVGGLLCIRRTRGRQQSWCFPTCWVSKEKQFTSISSNLIQLKAIFSFSLSPNSFESSWGGNTCVHVPIQLSFDSCKCKSLGTDRTGELAKLCKELLDHSLMLHKYVF